MADTNTKDNQAEPAAGIDPGAMAETDALQDDALGVKEAVGGSEEETPESLPDDSGPQAAATEEPEGSVRAGEANGTADDPEIDDAASAEDGSDILRSISEPAGIHEIDDLEKLLEGVEDSAMEPDETEGSPHGEETDRAEDLKTFIPNPLLDKENDAVGTDEQTNPEINPSDSPPAATGTSHNSRIPTAALLLGLLALALSVAAGLYAHTLKVELDGLQQQVAAASQALVATPTENSSAELDQLKTRIEEIDGRLAESLQAIETTREEWDTAIGRLATIEQSIASQNKKTEAATSYPSAVTAPEKRTPRPEQDAPPFPTARVGDWAVNLESHSVESDADKSLEELKKRGIPAEKFVIETGGMTWYRLRITGFARAEEAKRYIKNTASKDFPHAWLGRMQ